MLKHKGKWTSHCYVCYSLFLPARIEMLQYQAPVLLNIITTSCWPGKGCFFPWLAAYDILAFYVTFTRTRGDALNVCAHRNTIPLLWWDTLSVVEYTAPLSLQHARSLKHLSLGKFSSASQVSYVSYVSLLVLFAFTTKQIAVGPCQKSGERQQCCDNPRVKGVNMWREFHAWQVRHMASVFSLFTHANEQYADEQTWAQPRLPAAQNWHKACWCGSATSSRISLVCCSFWWLFKSDAFSLSSAVSAMYCQ